MTNGSTEVSGTVLLVYRFGRLDRIAVCTSRVIVKIRVHDYGQGNLITASGSEMVALEA